MRIRSIKPEFFLHDGIFDAEREEGLPLRVAYIGLWCAADREGRFKWEARRLGAAIMPYDGVEFSRVLDALATRGFIVKYTVGGTLFGAIPAFRKHQVINPRERGSELPEPGKAEVVTDAPSTRDERVATRDVPARGEGKGREGKGVTRQDAHTPALRGEQERHFPDEINTPEVHTAWDRWCEYCFERNHNRPPSFHTMDEHVKAIIKIAKDAGVARVPEAITNAIAKNLPIPCLPFATRGESQKQNSAAKPYPEKLTMDDPRSPFYKEYCESMKAQ